jgi:hypothetical protein
MDIPIGLPDQLYEQLYNTLAESGNYSNFDKLYKTIYKSSYISYFTFIYACEGGNLDICKCIYNNIPKFCIDWRACAYGACMNNHLEILKWINSINPKFDITNACIEKAICNNNYQIFIYLISLNKYLTNVIGLFRSCCRFGSIEIAKILLENYNIELEQCRDYYFLDCVTYENYDIADYIYSANIKSKTYIDILCYAIQKDILDMLKYILGKKPNIDFNIVDNTIEIGIYKIRDINPNILSYLENYYLDEYLDNNKECSICLDIGSNFSKLICGHIFHTKCIKEWCKKSRICPYCRFKF